MEVLAPELPYAGPKSSCLLWAVVEPQFGPLNCSLMSLTWLTSVPFHGPDLVWLFLNSSKGIWA